MKPMLASLVAALLATAGAASADKIKFEYWYGLTGDLGQAVADTCARFNTSQYQYEAVCVGQDSYEKAVQNTIAAFRAGKHPTLVQSFDAGTADLMLSGEFYPVKKLMEDAGYSIDWTNYFPGVADYYSATNGDFFSMPFNSSTPVYYYNKDQFAKAGITEAPLTWESMEAAFKALKASGQQCSLAYSPSTWVTSSNSRSSTTCRSLRTTTAMTGSTASCFSTRRCMSSTWKTSSGGSPTAMPLCAPLRRESSARQLHRGRMRDLLFLHRGPQHDPQAHPRLCLGRSDDPDL